MCNNRNIILAVLALAAASLLVAGCGPGRYYDKGVDKYNTRDYDGAIREFNKALAKDQNNEYPDTKEWVVKCYMGRAEKSYEENIYTAITDYARALEEGKRLGASQTLLDEAQRRNDEAVAERDRRAAESRSLQQQAEAAMNARNYDEAENLLAKAIKIDPRNTGANDLLNKVREIKRNIAESNRLVNEGNALLNAPAVGLRDAELAKGNFERAKTLYAFNADADAGITRAEGMIAVIKRDAETRYQEGLKHFEEKRWADSEYALQECLKLDYTRKDAEAKLQEARNMLAGQKNYETYLEGAKAKLAAETPSVDDAEEAIRLCDQAMAAYPFNDEAKLLRDQAVARRDECAALAEEHYKKGVAAMEARNWKEAEAEFTECLAICSARADAQAGLEEVREKIEIAKAVEDFIVEGESYLRTEKPYQGKRAFQDALGLDPGNPQAADGEKRADEMIVRFKDEARVLYDAALKKINDRDYEGALADLDKAVEKDPDRTAYTRKRDEVKKKIEQAQTAEEIIADAEKLLGENKPYDAKKQFQKALSTDPGNLKALDGARRCDEMIARFKVEAKALYDAALLKINKKDYEGALKDLDKAIEKDPETGTYARKRGDVQKMLTDKYYEQGQQYEQQEKWVLAQKEYEKAAQYDTKYDADALRMKNEAEAEGLIQHGNVLMGKKQYREAALDYKNALALTGREEMVSGKLNEALDKMKTAADAEWEKGNHEAALAQMDEILAIDPAYDDLKQIAADYRRRLDAAEKKYDEILVKRKEAKLVAAKALLEELLSDLPKYGDAEKILKEVNTSLATAKTEYDRGRRFEDQKKYDLAIAQYVKVVSIATDYEDAMDRAAKLKEAGDKYNLGVQMLGEKKLVEALDAFKAAQALFADYADVAEKIDAIQDNITEVEFLYKKGVQYQEQGKWQLAIERYEALLAMIYEYKDVQKRLDECRSHLP